MDFLGLSIVCGSQYTNPVVNSNAPDPGGLKLHDGSGYVVVSTSDHSTATTGPAFPIHFSTDLINWQLVLKSVFF